MTRSTLDWPMVRCTPSDRFSARASRWVPECGAPMMNTGCRTLRPLTMRMWLVDGMAAGVPHSVALRFSAGYRTGEAAFQVGLPPRPDRLRPCEHYAG